MESDPSLNKELQHLKRLLQIEKEEERLYFQRKNLQTSIPEKIKEGICLYPLYVKSHHSGMGDRWVVNLEADQEWEDHLFSGGKVVSLFQNQSQERFACSGVIRFIKSKELSLMLQAEEFPTWLLQGKIGMDLMMDEQSYLDMEIALQRVMESSEGPIYRFKKIIYGDQALSFREKVDPIAPKGLLGFSLNESQKRAVNTIVQANDLALVHGPPGTGKTTSLVAAIALTVAKEGQVLVCAPSNTAVDVLAEKLASQKLAVLRLGHPARVTEENLSLSLDAKVAGDTYYKDIKKLRKKAQELKNLAFQYKRNFGPSEREQRKLLLRESSQLKSEALSLEKYVLNKILSESQVICCTLTGANLPVLAGKTFPTVFIDEAGQALEPATWIPMLKAERVVLAGDHCQLPPTVKSQQAKGLELSLFEKCMKLPQASVMLEKQYRMHEQIMGFSNQYFYHGRLKADPSVASHRLTDQLPPLLWVDTAGSSFFEQSQEKNTSRYNPGESRFLFFHLLECIKEVQQSEEEAWKSCTVGLVSPYKAQVLWIKEQLEQHLYIQQYKKQISINTIDGFQGQERDIMYISLVRSNEQGEIGFLKDYRRMNVALTRARKRMVIIGDSSTLAEDPYYAQLLDYFQDLNSIRSIYEFSNFDGLTWNS